MPLFTRKHQYRAFLKEAKDILPLTGSVYTSSKQQQQQQNDTFTEKAVRINDLMRGRRLKDFIETLRQVCTSASFGCFQYS